MKRRPKRILAPLVVAAAVIFFAVPAVENIIFQRGLLVGPPKAVSILAFGDMMLDRTVRDYIDANGPYYPFEKIAPFLAGHDIVVANAEGIFSDRSSISQADHSILVFTFALSNLPTLEGLGFTIFNQANNHALNFGWAALKQSKDAMAQNDIASFGDPENVDPGPLYKVVRGEKIAFVGYSEFSSSAGDDTTTLFAIAAAKAAGAFTIVYSHWGVEYNQGTTTRQEIEAHKFIDAGADLILGSHPHVVEPVEVYKGKAIFYSVGNFIFDQTWNTAVSHGLSVEVWLKPKSVSYTLWQLTITKDRQVIPAAVPQSSFVLQRYQ